MPKRVADAQWQGDLQTGAGSVALGSGAFKGPYSFQSRFEDGSGTNPEELLGAAHAACFSMALSFALAQAGHVATQVSTRATVNFGPVPGGFTVSRIDLATEGKVAGIDATTFDKFAADAKVNCPISKALSAVELTLTSKLL